MSTLSRLVAKATFKKRVVKNKLQPSQDNSGHLRSGKLYLFPISSQQTC